MAFIYRLIGLLNENLAFKLKNYLQIIAINCCLATAIL